MSTSPSLTATLSIPALRDSIKGRVIAPGDEGYDDARAVMSGEFDRRPAVIVRVADAADVATVVAIARETGLELAIRSGGHSGAGHSTTDGGIVLDLRDMTGIEIDVDARTAWAETGLTAVELTEAVVAHEPRDRLRRHRLGRDRRDHARRRHRLPRAPLRPDHRLAARGRDRDGRRRAAASRCRDPPGPVLGDPRRRRQLRRRDPVPVPAARAAVGRRRDADPASDRRHDRRVHRRRGGRAGRNCRRSRTSCPARRCRSCPRSITASSSSWP